jgi:Uma2 family endonuclease
MTAQPKPYITEEAYLLEERRSTIKHEYHNGRVYAMAGASEQHNLIAINLAASLHGQLRGKGCRVYPSDMRLKIVKTGLNTYPDFSIVCGQSEFTDSVKRDTLLNPIVIIEILSPSTERYDRGIKFQHYRTIPSLKEYLLIAQNDQVIEKFTRQETNEWVLTEAVGIETVMPLLSVQISLALKDVYDEVPIIPEILPIITRDVPEDEAPDQG